MKKSELYQIIKEEILAEAKKDKSGLPFALAANIVKYGQPQTPKGAKKTDLTKKQEKSVKKTAEKLKKSIKENKDNYMFFQNLKTIKEAVDEMLAMDPEMVDMILSNGHDWANDHIATSKDDTEEVYNFLKSKSAALVAEDEKPNLKIGDKVKYENQEWEVEKFLSNGTVRLKHLKGLPSTNVSPEKIAKLQEKKLVGGQKKLDANKNGKIDAEDFKLLKAKKK